MTECKLTGLKWKVVKLRGWVLHFGLFILYFLLAYRALIGIEKSKKGCKIAVLVMKKYSINLF